MKQRSLLLLLTFLLPTTVLTQVKVPFEKYVLPNGLNVILHEDHSVPIVGVNVWYHVGSAREIPGKTGFAHLFEHMMFQGSAHVQKGEHFKFLQEAGGTLNGSTSTDRTNYWELVPSNFLELALYLESDRMGFLLDAMDQAKLDNQRDVVKNERRQNYENQPYGLAGKLINENLYPPDHPYHWLTIGTQEDLSNATLEDVMGFFRHYYGPNNASLCIGGDIDVKKTKELVEKYFGELKKIPDVPKIQSLETTVNGKKYLMMEDRVQLPRLYMVWPSVPNYGKNDAQLDLLAAVLAHGKNSRLYKALVYEKQIAQDVSASQFGGEVAGQFRITATAKPGHTLNELEKAVDEIIEGLKREGVQSHELERAKNGIKASFVYQLQSVGGFGGRTDVLNQYNVFLGDPGYFNEDLERYQKANASELQEVARGYLKPAGRIILSVVPLGKKELQAGE
ncbi:MAG: pitrilysin family protein [Bacteroidota bacterium]